MMKKILLYIVTIATALSCSLDRFYENGPSTGTYPSTPDEALSGLLACYKGLANTQVQYCPFPFRVVDQLSDIGTIRVGGAAYESLVTSVATPSAKVPGTAYTKIYRIAGRIHLVLDNLDNIKVQMDPVEFAQLKAELLLLRAYIYDMGCQFYGDIPFIDHCLSLTDYEYGRTPKEEVIDRILSDIPDELLDNLPVQWPYAQWGTCRIGRATAYALKAQINLNWGRYAEAQGAQRLRWICLTECMSLSLWILPIMRLLPMVSRALPIFSVLQERRAARNGCGLRSTINWLRPISTP